MRGLLGFLFYTAIVLAPVLIAVSVASHFLRRDRFMGFATLAVVIGFLAGGVVGWAGVPAQWTAEILQANVAHRSATRIAHRGSPTRRTSSSNLGSVRNGSKPGRISTPGLNRSSKPRSSHVIA